MSIVFFVDLFICRNFNLSLVIVFCLFGAYHISILWWILLYLKRWSNNCYNFSVLLQVERDKFWSNRECSVDIHCLIHRHQVLPYRLLHIDRDVGVISLRCMKLLHLHRFYLNLHRQRLFSKQLVRWYHSPIRLPLHRPGSLNGVHRYVKIFYEEVYLLVFECKSRIKLNTNTSLIEDLFYLDFFFTFFLVDWQYAKKVFFS